MDTSSVINFNRLPTFNTATIRRECISLVGAFFDDTGILDLSVGQGSAQEAVHSVYIATGSSLSKSKGMPCAPQLVYLGPYIEFSRVTVDGIFGQDVKDGLREQIVDTIDSII